MKGFWPVVALLSSLKLFVFLYVLLLPLGSIAAPLAAFICLGSIAVIVSLFKQYEKRLRKRMAATNEIVWNVQLNGIDVGKITDAEYATMRLAALKDSKNAVEQLFNLGSVFFKGINRALWMVPIYLFWMGAVIFCLNPNLLGHAVDSLHYNAAADITPVANFFVLIVAVLSLLSVIINFAVGCKYGFVDCYANSIFNMLRRHCHHPLQGEISLSRSNGEEMEFLYLRGFKDVFLTVPLLKQF